MKLIVVGTEASPAVYAPLMRAGHKVLGYANTTGRLAALAQLERPDGLLIVGAFCDTPAALAALLQQMGLPAAIIAPPGLDTDPLTSAGVLVLDDGTDLVTAAAALQARVGVPATPSAQPAGGSAPCPPPAAPAGVPPPPPTTSARPGDLPGPLVLRAVLGGVGSSGLALTLATAAAECGMKVLAVSLDPVALAVRLGLPPAERDQPRRCGALTALVLSGPTATLPGGYDWIVMDRPRYATWAGEGRPQVQRVLVTRPTGEGRLAVVQAIAEWHRSGLTAAQIVLNGPGPLSAAEFTRLVTADLGACPPVTALPWDPQVAILEDAQGQALAAPRYGPAVQQLARQLAPALPWPALEPEKSKPAAEGTTAEPGRRWRLQLPRVEVTE